MLPLFITIAMSYHNKSSWFERVALQGRDSIFYLMALLPFIGIFLWYNYYKFGSILETGYLLKAERLGINFFTGTSLLTGLGGFLLSAGKGFFYYSPVALLFFFSIKSFIKKYTAIGISFILIIVSYLLFLSKNIYWHGVWAWGPRYLLVLTPFLIIPIAEIFESTIWQKKLMRIVVYSIFTLSIVIQIAAVSVDYRKYFFNLYIEEGVGFTVTEGKGVQSVNEPPSEIYFDWHKSPILAQFSFIYNITKNNIEDYNYVPVSEDAPIDYQIKSSPYMNTFDFWWLYEYYVDRSHRGFYIALILLIMIIYTSSNLWKLMHKKA